MVLSQVDMVYCVCEVYDSSKATGFEESDKYPIAWEVIFRNDNAGKQLIENLYSAFEQLPKVRGKVIGLDGEHSDIARCLECVFDNEHSFKQILNKSLNGLTLFDENTNRFYPKHQLIDEAKNIGKLYELSY